MRKRGEQEGKGRIIWKKKEKERRENEREEERGIEDGKKKIDRDN